LALAVLVSADTLGLLAPTGQTDFSRQSSEGPAQTLEFAAAPESSSTTAEDNSETPMASSEAYDAAPPDLTPAPGADSMQSLRSEESLPESSEAGPALAQPPAETDAETMALPAQPGSEEAGTAGRASGAAESTEPANDGNSLTEKAGQSSESETELSNEGPAEGRSDSGAVLTPGQYQDTPWVWRALEGVAAALLLALLGVMVVRRVMSRRTGS
jgi:hypothetical protein